MKNQKRILLSLIFLSFFSPYHSIQCYAQDKMNGPSKIRSTCNDEKYREGKNFLFNFYQNWISPIRGSNNCPMHPSCSQYAKNAFQILPWYEAYTKSLERLLRCGNELYLYGTIRINGTDRWHDPVIRKELNGD